MNQNPKTQNTPSTGKGMSVAGLVLGIVGLVGGFIPFVNYFTTVCSILGLIFACIGMKKSKLAFGKASGLAVAGLVLSIIGTAFAVIGLICTIACLGSLGCMAESLNDPDIYDSLYDSLY